jgi:methanogenic corrinoid protein MtbC1
MGRKTTPPAVQANLPDIAKLAQAGRKGEQAVLLSRAVEAEIIPRLVRAHVVASPTNTPAFTVIKEEDVERLTHLVLHAEDAALHEAVAGLRQRGASLQSIFLDLLAPVANKLGDYWNCDHCSFTEVTVAMGRLQQLLRANSAAFGLGGGVPEGQDAQKRILLLPSPGEQHTFGLSLVAEFFYRAGWSVSTSFIQPSGSLSALVEREWFDVVGLSLGNVAQVGKLDDCIRQIRRASMNPHILTIVGGVAFMLEPDLAEQVSADAVITDAQTAPSLAQSLLKQASLQP